MFWFCFSLIIHILTGPIGSIAAPQTDGFNVVLRNDDGSWKPLYEIVITGDENAIREVLSHTSDVNMADEGGSTALHFATNSGNEKIVALLIQNNANVNKANRQLNTALHFAAISGHEKIANLLIRSGADVNAANKFGENSLHYAANSGREVIVDLLLQNGANIDAVNEYGDTAMHFAANNGHAKIITLLAKKGANYNAINRNGNQPLHLAANNDKDEAVEALLSYNADRNHRNSKGKTAKDLAIEKGYQRIIDLFKKISTAQKACEIYENLPGDKILTGVPVEEAELPWMVALGYLNEEYKISFDCGGTIISDFFILTAAHCITSQRRPVVIRIGSIALTNDEEDESLRPKNRHVETIIKHPGYLSTTKLHDIALIKVSKRMDFSATVRPACLNTDLSDVDKDVKLLISGWGLLSPERRDRPNRLLKATLNTVPLSQCNDTVLEFNKIPDFAAFRKGVAQSQYCALDPDRKSDTCQGDSGGPLQQIPPGSDVAKIVGIVSFGIGCGSPWPGIYTRVASYIDWIESYVWPNGINNTLPAYNRRMSSFH